MKSVSTVCNEIYVEMRKISKHLEHSDVMLRVNPEVAKALKANNAQLLNEMEELTKKTMIVKSRSGAAPGAVRHSLVVRYSLRIEKGPGLSVRPFSFVGISSPEMGPICFSAPFLLRRYVPEIFGEA